MSFRIAKGVREKVPRLQQLSETLWIVRGLLPFDAGVVAVHKHFAALGEVADIYNHKYMIEPEYWPEQPSPAFHLTEELQGLTRLVRGMSRPWDRNVMLDDTATIILCPTTRKLLLYNPVLLDEEGEGEFRALTETYDVGHVVVPTRQAANRDATKRWIRRFREARVHCSVMPPDLTSSGPSVLQMTAKSAAGPIDAIVSGDGGPKRRVQFGRTAVPTTTSPSVLEDESIEAALSRCVLLSPEGCALGQTPVTSLLAGTVLWHVPGDVATNEFVLYHEPSSTLVSTDLYHAPYTDFDCMNSWMCRVWFKLNRQGNYKSSTILPAFRKAHLDATGQLPVVAGFVKQLTETCPIDFLVASHGTSPVKVQQEVLPSSLLREMYGLPPILTVPTV